MQGITVSSIEVCDLQDNTFYARIHFLSQDQQFSMDARPSDAIGIALRFEAPIFIDQEVIAKARPFEADAEASDDSEEGRKWKEYLENLSPEDFGKYKVYWRLRLCFGLNVLFLGAARREPPESPAHLPHSPLLTSKKCTYGGVVFIGHNM
jgi:hypothetical protein